MYDAAMMKQFTRWIRSTKQNNQKPLTTNRQVNCCSYIASPVMMQQFEGGRGIKCRPIKKKSVEFHSNHPQPLFDEISECITNISFISFHKGLPTKLDSFAEGCKHDLVLLDNLMDDVVRDTEI